MSSSVKNAIWLILLTELNHVEKLLTKYRVVISILDNKNGMTGLEVSNSYFNILTNFQKKLTIACVKNQLQVKFFSYC